MEICESSERHCIGHPVPGLVKGPPHKSELEAAQERFDKACAKEREARRRLDAAKDFHNKIRTVKTLDAIADEDAKWRRADREKTRAFDALNEVEKSVPKPAEIERKKQDRENARAGRILTAGARVGEIEERLRIAEANQPTALKKELAEAQKRYERVQDEV